MAGPSSSSSSRLQSLISDESGVALFSNDVQADAPLPRSSEPVQLSFQVRGGLVPRAPSPPRAPVPIDPRVVDIERYHKFLLQKQHEIRTRDYELQKRRQRLLEEQKKDLVDEKYDEFSDAEDSRTPSPYADEDEEQSPRPLPASAADASTTAPREAKDTDVEVPSSTESIRRFFSSPFGKNEPSISSALKKRALEEATDKSVFDAFERFFVPFPWSVVPKFASLLIRSLGLDYTAVFCTGDFVRRVRRVSLTLIQQDPIKTSVEKMSDQQRHPILSAADHAILREYLKKNTLNLIASTLLGVCWCVEKAAMIVRAKARIDIFEILLNDVATTVFVNLCKHIFNDARINSRRKYSPVNVLQYEEAEKQSSINFFVKLDGVPPAENVSRELSVFAVNKQNARRVAAFADDQKTTELVESLKTRGVDFDKLGRRGSIQLGNWFETAIDGFPMDPTLGTPHYTDPMYGYFIRLVDEASARGLGYETDSYDIALEEILPIHFLRMGFLETYINDRLGPAANCLRMSLATIASATGHGDKTWDAVLLWCIQDRDRLIQLVELTAIHRNLDRVIDRSSAALDPVVARRMDGSMHAIVGWFREINRA